MRATPAAKRIANSYGAPHNDSCPNASHDVTDVTDVTDVKHKSQHKPQSDVGSVPIRIDQPDDDTNDHTIGSNVKEQHRSNQQCVPVSDSEQNR
jgi:hypothetical protein